MTYAISRRALLHGSLGVAGSGLFGAAPSRAGTRTDAEIYGVPTTNPLVEQRADPFISRPVDGMYYFTGSVPEYDRIALRGARTLAGLAAAPETVIWRHHATGEMANHIWAPELHFIDGKWYVYFAADLMDLGRPDVGAHLALRVAAPHHDGLGRA